MVCKRCGKNNPPSNNRCFYCNAHLDKPRDGSSDTQSEKGILIIILILILVLFILIAVYFTGCNSSRSGFGVGGGGGGGAGLAVLNPGHNPQPGYNPGSGESGNTESGNDESGNGGNGGVGGSGIEIVEGDDSQSGDSSSSGSSGSDSEEATPGPVTDSSPESSDNPLPHVQKDKYLKRAAEIEEYSGTHLTENMSQHELNNESEIVFRKWDYLLNDVYQYLETYLSDEDFAALEAEEIEWIREKEAAMQQTREEWEGGSGMTYAVNMVAINYTMTRCYYLIEFLPTV